MHRYSDEEAFEWYVSQGETRSITATAKHFGVSRRSMTKCVRRGNWHARLAEIERKAHERADRKMAETLAQVRERHLQLCRAMQSRGAQAIKAHELADAMQGAKTIEMAVKLERLILGEADSRTALNIDEITRREVEMFLAHPDEVEEPDGAETE